MSTATPGAPAPGAASPGDSSAAAIRSLAERGYDATTTEHLAEALGISRSTFFRRFGGKDDVVFADHDQALAILDALLAETELPVDEAVISGTAAVLRLLTRDPEAARMRFELMHRTPALRDRELVITHRYERVIAHYLRRALPDGTPSWVPTALAAATVAVHNAALRDWLRGRAEGADGVARAARTDRASDIGAAVERQLRALTERFSPWLSPDGDAERRRVLVAVYDATGAPEAVLDAVTAGLSGQPLASLRELPSCTAGAAETKR